MSLIFPSLLASFTHQIQHFKSNYSRIRFRGLKIICTSSYSCPQQLKIYLIHVGIHHLLHTIPDTWRESQVKMHSYMTAFLFIPRETYLTVVGIQFMHYNLHTALDTWRDAQVKMHAFLFTSIETYLIVVGIQLVHLKKSAQYRIWHLENYIFPPKALFQWK